MFAELTNLLPSDFTASQWFVLCACAVLVGLSKTGIPGMGILVVPIIASFFPAKISTGLLLPLLAMADLFAVGYYHRHAKWSIVLKLLPPALVGIAAGSFVMRQIDDDRLRPAIGLIVLIMLVLNYLWDRKERNDNIPRHWLFAAAMGFLAGLTTQLANAAGPVMTIYLLAVKLPKYEFIGTGAWYFLILNWLKLPIFISEGRISLQSVCADVAMLPLIAVGAIAGIVILKKIPQKWFKIVVQILATAAAVKLLMH